MSINHEKHGHASPCHLTRVRSFRRCFGQVVITYFFAEAGLGDTALRSSAQKVSHGGMRLICERSRSICAQSVRFGSMKLGRRRHLTRSASHLPHTRTHSRHRASNLDRFKAVDTLHLHRDSDIDTTRNTPRPNAPAISQCARIFIAVRIKYWDISIFPQNI